MRPAGLAHTVIVVQSTSKKNGEPAAHRNGAHADLDHLLRAAHQRRARTGSVRVGKLACRGVRRVIRSCPPRRRWQA